jgi:predicted RNA-binding protein Jag
VTINLKLNSYDRRVIHVEVAEVDGVESQSVVKDDVKLVQVVPFLS